MAGKSTYLRQNALIAALAQMGSFVPARAARIGIVDRLFSRVGAADDLARGRSTFMVEMVETAAILNQATERSLVILDEIGRGTATYDGLSIAQACVERLNDVNRCRTLFATHFHELTRLAETMPRLFNLTMRVREHRGATRIPARGRARRRRPLLWRPGRAARRPAAGGGQARAGAARGAGGRRRGDRAAAFRPCSARARADARFFARNAGRTRPRRLVAARGAGHALRTQADGGGGVMDAKILLASGIAAYLYVISPGPAFLALFTLAGLQGAGAGREIHRRPSRRRRHLGRAGGRGHRRGEPARRDAVRSAGLRLRLLSRSISAGGR